MRAKNRCFSSGVPKCITAQRSAGILKLLVAEVMVMVRAAISGRQRRQWDMRVARIDDVGVDLVRHHDQVVADGECRHLLEFRPGEGAAGRVLRMAEDQHPRARIGRRLIRGKVEHPARAVVAHRVGDQPAAGVR